MTAQVVLDMTAQGPVPQSPQALRDALLALAVALDPGLTGNLPGSLIDDIASTDVGALTVIDSALQDLINSVSPRLANMFMLVQLGQIYGVPQGLTTNTSVLVVFAGPPGFTIQRGFVVSDGTHQYAVQDGGIIGAGGSSPSLFALATEAGAWAVPQDTVNQLITSVPDDLTPDLTVNNPTDGVPQAASQTEEEYRVQVLQGGKAIATGIASFLRTQLENVAGVQARLISVREDDGLWEVIVGGGDPYEVANAIFIGIGGGIPLLTGSVFEIVTITNANPGIFTTNLNHGYTTGDAIVIAGVTGTTGVNGSRTATVTGLKTFSIGINTTSSGAYTGGGTVTPNERNVTVSVNDYPDTYEIPFVNPPQQTTAVALTWNTTSPNFVSDVAVAQVATPVIIDYINSIVVGQPINIFELNSIFQQAVADLIPVQYLSRIVWAVSIDGISTNPDAGTGLIEGDAESYFYADTSTVTVAQG